MTDWSDRRAKELNITRQQYANWQAGYPPEDVETVEKALLKNPNWTDVQHPSKFIDLNGQEQTMPGAVYWR